MCRPVRLAQMDEERERAAELRDDIFGNPAVQENHGSSLTSNRYSKIFEGELPILPFHNSSSFAKLCRAGVDPDDSAFIFVYFET
ncbi:hypothetical protein EJ110_NYTH43649 [Nymphaea thermarum]|nr:hypothetical protein EJ110_NYTH43649 [Nymphaea thermarum]